MSRWFRFGLLLPLFLLASAGCVSNHYEVELTPEGKSLKREITVWRGGGDKPDEPHEFPKEELEKIAKAYHVEVPSKLNQKHKFAGAFAGEMPEDVGGRGSFTHWETSLGSLSIYVERFRGSDNLLADVETRMKACDQMVNLLTGWLELELKNEPGFSELQQFLDGEFRRDVKNLSLLTWTFTNLGTVQGGRQLDEKPGQEFVIRAQQYLIEREYLTLDQVPALYRAIVQDDPDRLLNFLKRLLARKMGVPKDQPMPKGLGFLDDPIALKKSFDAFLEESEDYRELAESYQQRADDQSKPPKPDDVLTEALFPAFPLLRFADDRLTVKLAVPVEPTSTNGQWNAEAKQVHWSRSLLGANANLTEFPAMCYAIWSEPNAKAQTERFGKVVLEGQSLANYCLWQRGLSEAEAQEWETFLASLKPGNDLAPRLRSFRFSREPAPQGNDKNRLAKVPRELILEGLGEPID